MSPRIGLDLTAILAAAIEMADRQGLGQVTLAALAQKLDIRSPSLYNHVNGLPGLKRKLALYGVQQLTAEMTKAAVGRSGDEAIHAMAQSYVAFARRHPGLYEATLRAPDNDDQELQKSAAEIIDMILRVLEVYELSEDDALHMVRCLRSLLHGFASLEQQGGFGMPLDLDQTLNMLTNTFLAGIRELNRARSN